MRYKVFKHITVTAIISCFILGTINLSYAADTKEITLEQAITKTIANSHSLDELDFQINSMWIQRNDLLESAMQIQSVLDDIENYRDLFDRKNSDEGLSILEQKQLVMYIEIFGPRPPEMSSAELFHTYIKSRDFPSYSIYGAYENACTNRKLTEASIKSGVRKLYDSILDMQDTINLQQQLYDNMLKQHEQLEKKYATGYTSSIEIYLSENSLNQKELDLYKIKRSLENLKMSLKKMMNIPLNEDISFLPYSNTKIYYKQDTYNIYLNRALENRSEILIAKMNLKVKERELSIMKQYITNEQADERIEAQLAYDEKKIAYDEAIGLVQADIYSGYNDVISKKVNIDITKKKYENAQKQYKNEQICYNDGLISNATLINMQIALTQAKIEYNDAIRNYDSALCRLDDASGIGPEYN